MKGFNMRIEILTRGGDFREEKKGLILITAIVADVA